MTTATQFDISLAAPGWENRMSATPESAEQAWRDLYHLMSQEFTNAARGRHVLMDLAETRASNELILEICCLQNQLITFAGHRSWLPEWSRYPRTKLSEDVQQTVAEKMEIIDTVHRPLPFGLAILAWQAHALQPGGGEDIPFRRARNDWDALCADFKGEPEFPDGFKGIYLGFDPPQWRYGDLKYDHTWENVTYDPDLGYAAAVHILRLNHAGKQRRREVALEL